jgi:hypothetical protein
MIRLCIFRIAKNSDTFEKWADVMNCHHEEGKDSTELAVYFKSIFEEMDEIAKEERILLVIICSE